MFVPDLLHECELGTWKSLFIHLIRMLNTQGATKVAIFNSRYVTYRPYTSTI
jgi:hypothetical protein